MTRTLFIAACLAGLSLPSPALAQSSPPAGPTTISATNEAATRGPLDAALVGALHEFAYEPGAIYAVQASPQRITDIALEPGETLLSVSAGDTTRWIVGDARSGAGDSSRSHILVKPNAANLATNLVIMTDRRVYHIDLKASSGAAMASVAWRYPAAMTLATREPPDPPPAAAAPAPLAVLTPETLNLRYRIEGDWPDWRPLSA